MSDAIAHIFHVRTSSEPNNYLDDFLLINIIQHYCNQHVDEFMEICEVIGMPLSPEKTCWATQIIIFLGMLINTLTQTISIPVEKRDRALGEIDIVLRSKKITVHELQKLTGLLNFLG